MDESYFGDYECHANNPIGTTKRMISLKEGSKAGIPDVSVAGQSTDSIKLDVKPPAGDELPILGYRLEYFPGEPVQWHDAPRKDVNNTGNSKHCKIMLENKLTTIISEKPQEKALK